jgi:crotonobetainyl-CoA:carnitine CoA-transferase CaiB-like acyl-CoA transferase
MAHPLDGVKVLDLCRVLAGPFAGRMLADLGADVVKVEPPEGDVSRTFGKRPESAYFRQQNAGKRSITVDLRDPAGCELVRRLAATADIVLENFRPGIMARYGLAWSDLSARNPRLVMLSISGFGQDGPERDRASYAGVIHAETGVVARRRTEAGGLPLDIEISMADTVTGLHGVVGVLAALRLRDQTGIGQHVDMAMIDAMAFSDDYLPNEVAAGQARARRLAAGDAGRPDAGADHLRNSPNEIIDAPGGPIIVMGEFRWIWKSINERCGVADPTPPGAGLEEKVAARQQAWRDFYTAFTTREELLAALDRANLAWGIVRPGAEALSSPTLAHRGSVVEIDDPDGAYTVTRAPYRFSAGEAGVRRGAPRQDQHHDEVIADWLG